MPPDEFPDPWCDAIPKPARAEPREQPRRFEPLRWHAVSAVVDAALELPPEERAGYVAQACAGDAELRAEVEQLLRACESADRSDRFMAEPAGAFAAPVIADLDVRVAAAESRGMAAIAAALSERYTVERELGRGGMATVYLARDLKHGRPVAVKVLRPGLATALGPERFLREIAVAAGLTHSNILPLFDSGAGGHGGGLLYYVMPYVDGESLRDRLRRETQLPLDDALQIARDVAAALDYAHRNGIVHRDIKPENILLEGGRAMVADFGLALAISAAGGDRLTETGVAIGTPSYMSPEQATGEPRIDGRSDVYSLACAVYEMLAGEPPFTGPSAQAVIAKRLVVPPPQLSLVRDALPAAADRVLARAMARVPADRYQTAGEFVAALARAVGQGPESAGEASLADRLRGARLLPILALYLLASAAVLGAAYVAMMQLGLPDWVLPGALVLLLIGLPIILTTAVVQGGHRGLASVRARAAPAPHTRHWLTWRKAISGGVLAFAALGAAVSAYMALRALGIGPVGSLVAAGVVKERERVLVADFVNRTRDSTLGLVLTEALRIDLAQSPLMRLVPASTVRDGLKRMQRPANSALDPAVARELAVREGIRVVITGDIASVGPRFVVSARLVAADSGEVLAAYRETARDSAALVSAVDRLSKRLRERLGESLRTIRASQPLHRVTTTSLDALRKYTEGRRVTGEGDPTRAAALLEEAIALDTTFAMAYRALSVAHAHSGAPRSRVADALTQAFRYSDRLTDRERYVTLGDYYTQVTGEYEKAIAAYRALLDVYPDLGTGLVNLGLVYDALREHGRAEQLYRRNIETDSLRAGWVPWWNVIASQVDGGKLGEARTTLERMHRIFGDKPFVMGSRRMVAEARGEYDVAESLSVAGQQEQREPDPHLAGLALLRGRVAAAEAELKGWIASADRNGQPGDALIGATQLAYIEAAIRRRPRHAAIMLDSALARSAAAIPARDRPYLYFADAFAAAGRPDRARAVLAEFDSVTARGRHRGVELLRHQIVGTIELAEGHVQRAIAEFRLGDREGCPICALPGLGRAYDLVGQLDSAIAIYERYLGRPWERRVGMEPQGGFAEGAVQLVGPDDRHRAHILRRLGELYEGRGDRAKAASYYAQFVELWKHCDPELKPQVHDVRARLARLDESDVPG